MIINVKVKPNSKESKVQHTESLFSVSLKSKPHENIANKELILLLSKYFNVSKTCIRIIKGQKSRNKVIEIEE